MLDALVNPASTLIVTGGDDSTVRGFLARAPWRGGALIAPDPDERLRMGQRALAKVRAEFAWSKKADRMMDLYAQAVRPPAGRGEGLVAR